MCRVVDGKKVAIMPVQKGVRCVAASRDGRWIAAGTTRGDVFVWDAKNYKQVYSDRTGSSSEISDVDFSPDSTRLVSAAGQSTALIWDIAACQKVRLILDHDGPVIAAKYSPQGDRIATATHESVRVWDSKDGRLRLDVAVQVGWVRNLLWCKDHIFVRTKRNTIKQINAVTGSTVSEWSVPGAQWPRITLPQHGKFIACSADKAITVWDAATHAQLNLIPHTDNISSFAFSSDDSLLAIASVGSKIIVKRLFQSVSVRSFRVFDPSLLYLSVTSHSRTQNLVSTALHSMHGNADNSRMQKRYYLRQFQHR